MNEILLREARANAVWIFLETFARFRPLMTGGFSDGGVNDAEAHPAGVAHLRRKNRWI
jgi:hypothetical protein